MKQSHDFRPSGRHDNQIKVKQPRFPIEMNKVKQPEFPIEMTIEITQQLEVHNTHISLPGELSWQSCRCRGRVGQDEVCTKLNGQNNIRQVQRQRADHKDSMQDMPVDKHSHFPARDFKMILWNLWLVILCPSEIT